MFQIPLASDTQDLVPAMASYARAGRCALFVGAGLSRAVGYPDWRGLLDKLIAEACPLEVAPDAHDELRRMLAAGKLADVADQCREVLGKSALFGFLRRELARPEIRPLEETHGAIVRTPYSCIVTTNFDTLLEDAYQAWGARGVPKTPTGIELAHQGTLLLDGAFFILKAHGSLTDESSIVFATEDYRRIIHANPAFQSVMSTILMTHAVLFVGYSLSDPNFRLLIESQLTTFGTDSPPRYAVMEDVGAYERALMERTMGIRVLSYPKGRHGDVALLLNGIAAAATERPSAQPSARHTLIHRSLAPTKSLVVRLRARAERLDLNYFMLDPRISTPADVPLERRSFGSVAPLDWSALRPALEVAISTWWQDDGAVRRAGRELGKALPDALLTAFGKRGLQLVVFDLDACTASLPWEWVPVGRKLLLERVPTCRTLASLSDSARGRPFVRTPLRALVVSDTQPRQADTGGRFVLDASRDEGTAVTGALRRAQKGAKVVHLTGRQATYGRVMSTMRESTFDVVHFAGYASMENGVSYLALHDHVLHASELAMLFNRRPPAMVFLNTLYSGFVPAFAGPDQSQLPRYASIEDLHQRLAQRRCGFEYAVARAGVGSFVGCMGTSSDTGSAALAVLVYERLLKGDTLATALHQARRTAKTMMSTDITPYYILMAGYPDLRLVALELQAGRHRHPA